MYNIYNILHDIFIIILVGLIILLIIGTFIYEYKWSFKADKTITGYETRTCTIYSDGTEDCEIERG